MLPPALWASHTGELGLLVSCAVLAICVALSAVSGDVLARTVTRACTNGATAIAAGVHCIGLLISKLLAVYTQRQQMLMLYYMEL